MKKIVILCILCILQAGCSSMDTNSTNSPSRGSGSSMDPAQNTWIEIPKVRTEENSPKKMTMQVQKNLQKTSFLSFEEQCPFFQCKKARQHAIPGDTGTAVDAPAGYYILALDALPKDYILIVKEGKIFTYQPSSKKITPFTVDTSGQQLTLGKNEGITGKESFTKKGTYLLIKFLITDPEVTNEDMSFLSSGSEPNSAYIYDANQDTLRQITSFSPKIFYSQDSETPELISHPYEFDALEERIIVYGGFAPETHAGPMGDFNPAILPLKVFSLDGKLIKEYTEGILSHYLFSAPYAFILHYEKDVDAKGIFDDRPIGKLLSITQIDLKSPSLTTTTFTLAQTVRAFLTASKYQTVPKALEDNFSYIPLPITREKDTLTINGFGDYTLLFTISGESITKVELQKLPLAR